MSLTSLDNWDRRVAATWTEHSDKVLSVSWHPTKPMFLSSSADHTVLCWAVPGMSDGY